MEKSQFNLLLRTQSSCLTPQALKFTKDADEAKDLIQDTLVKAYCNADRFREGTNFKGWLYTIMRNQFVNNFRKKTRKFYSIETDGAAMCDKEHQASNKGESNIVLEHIYAVLNSLPPKYSVPFSLHLEGYKYQEIQARLLMPIGTIKNRIHVARQILKEKIT